MKQKPIRIAEWKRSPKEQIRIILRQFAGRNVIELRTWWTDQNGKERPGRHGITLDVSHTPKLAKEFNRARRIATRRGLLGDQWRTR
jgi:Transcriptional Coactivator p15 (PC4)